MTDSRATAAVHFQRDAYNSELDRILGRQAAGAGFLKALVRCTREEPFYCYAPSQAQFNAFRKTLAGWGSTGSPIWIPYAQARRLAEVGCLYHPDPILAELAWQRRGIGSASYSLCGVTHTTCSAAIMDALGALVLAPLEPWDALVCTSQAVKASVEHVMDRWQDHLSDHLSAQRKPKVNLPIIPLGVDCEAFDPAATASDSRRELRSQMGMADGDVAILFVGRLSYHAKAHPLPLYLALEAVAQRTSKRLHLVQFGWFANSEIKEHFITAARQVCPTVTPHFFDGRQDMRTRIWHVADIFTSLSDNIQETFGLSPIEAMAAGLPSVVSDWNGYRDTVRDGIDGFRVPTLMPPAGAGEELMRRYVLGVDSYDRYVGNASQFVAVDVAATARAFEVLSCNDDLRRSMGAAARRRAREMFDWPLVVHAYRELWQEMAQRRKRAIAEDAAPRPRPHPLRGDPFEVFMQYASQPLSDDCIIEAGPSAKCDQLQMLAAMPMNAFALHLTCTDTEREALMARIVKNRRVSLRELLADSSDDRRAVLHRTLCWLAKIDAVRIAVPDGTRESTGDALTRAARLNRDLT